jgi:hypothetical protein
VSDPFFDPMLAGAPAADDQKPSTIFVDPTLVRIDERDGWEARAAQWRARARAEAVFGGEVEARLTGQMRGPFRGLLHLDVPFTELREHRARERVFMTAVGTDPVLARVPLVFVFGVRTSAPR